MSKILVLFLLTWVLVAFLFVEPVQSASSSKQKKPSSSSDSKSSNSKSSSSSSKSSSSSSKSSSSSSSKSSKSGASGSSSSSKSLSSSSKSSPSKSSSKTGSSKTSSKSTSSSKRTSGSAPLSKQPSTSLATGSELIARYGRPYNAGENLLWRIDHGHGTPNTPSWYLHFFELKYLWPFVESVGKHLWLDSSPLHVTPTSSKSSQEAYVTAPLYTLCDMLPIQSRVACVATSQDVPQCSSKKNFLSQIDDIRTKNRSACFHSPVMTNRSKIARQRYELLRDPHVRLDFHTPYKQLYTAFEDAYKTLYTNNIDKNFTSVRVPATGTVPPLGNGTVIRINRLAQVLKQDVNPSRFVVVHWQCASYASESLSYAPTAHKVSSVADARHRKLATSTGSKSSSSTKSKSKPKAKAKASAKSSPQSSSSKSQPSKSSSTTSATTTASKKSSPSKQQKANQHHQSLLAQCGKEFDGLLKFIDRERRMIWSGQKNVSNNNAVFPKNHWQWVIVVTPPQDEMFATLRLSDWKKHILLEQQLKQPQLLASSMSVSSPFFSMLRRRLSVFEANKRNATVTSPNDRFPPVRLSRDVVQELWPKLKAVSSMPHNLASQVHTKNEDIHTAAAAAAKVQSAKSENNDNTVEVPSMVETHALEAQLMVNAKVFYGMAQGSSLVQDVIDSERQLRQDRTYCFFVTPAGYPTTPNMVFPTPLDRQSWCYAATSPRAKPRNEMVKYP